MSKPDKPGELKSVKVKMVSLVGSPANRRAFAIYKSAQQTEGEGVPMTSQDAEGLFATLKSFFSGAGKEVNKGVIADAITERKARELFSDAFWAMRDAIFEPNGAISNGGWAAARPIAVEFIQVCDQIAEHDNVLLKSCAAEVSKTGRKISGTRLKKLTEARDMIAAIISEAELNEEGDDDVNKEQLQEAVKEVFAPFEERISALEKAAQENEPPEERSGLKNEEDGFKEELVATIKAALQPLEERLDKVEKARGNSNRVPDDENVQKSGPDWGGAFA